MADNQNIFEDIVKILDGLPGITVRTINAPAQKAAGDVSALWAAFGDQLEKAQEKKAQEKKAQEKDTQDEDPFAKLDEFFSDEQCEGCDCEDDTPVCEQEGYEEAVRQAKLRHPAGKALVEDEVEDDVFEDFEHEGVKRELKLMSDEDMAKEGIFTAVIVGDKRSGLANITDYEWDPLLSFKGNLFSAVRGFLDNDVTNGFLEYIDDDVSGEVVIVPTDSAEEAVEAIGNLKWIIPEGNISGFVQFPVDATIDVLENFPHISRYIVPAGAYNIAQVPGSDEYFGPML